MDRKKLALECGAVDSGIISIQELPDDQIENAKKVMPNCEVGDIYRHRL